MDFSKRQIAPVVHVTIDFANVCSIDARRHPPDRITSAQIRPSLSARATRWSMPSILSGWKVFQANEVCATSARNLAPLEISDLIAWRWSYLPPLTFSRRHWRIPAARGIAFPSVSATRKAKPSTDTEGNWRDIFQNWEALPRAIPNA